MDKIFTKKPDIIVIQIIGNYLINSKEIAIYVDFKWGKMFFDKRVKPIKLNFYSSKGFHKSQ